MMKEQKNVKIDKGTFVRVIEITSFLKSSSEIILVKKDLKL